MKWRIEAAAQVEVEEAAAWYEATRDGLAAEFLDEFDAGVRRIAEFPHAWQPIANTRGSIASTGFRMASFTKCATTRS